MRREQDEAERRLRLESEQQQRRQLHGQGHGQGHATDEESDRRRQRRIDAKLHEMETRRMMEHLKVQCTS